MLAGKVLLSNSIENATWTATPAEPMVCESCWCSGCAQTGLARIVRLGKFLVWLPPRPRDIDESWSEQVDQTAFIHEPVLIPVDTWEALRRRFSNMPPAGSYPRAARSDVATAWILGMPEQVRVAELRAVKARLAEALASDPLDLVAAINIVECMTSWVSQQPERAAEGQLVRLQDCKEGVNTFYFDGPPFEEWPAFAIGKAMGFTLGADWIFRSDMA
jgi:hypothetical protein